MLRRALVVLTVLWLVLDVSLHSVYGLYRELDESPGLNFGYGVCAYRDVLYVIGSINGNMSIVVISATNGSKLFSWVSPWVGELYDCVFINGTLYVVGARVVGDVSRWFIGVFSSDLKLLSWRISYERAAALSIVYDDGFLYVAGFKKVGTVNGFDDVGWVIEKISKDNVSDYIYVSSNPSTGGDIASAIVFNSAEKLIWVAGLNAFRRMWRIEIYNENLSMVKYKDLDIPNYPYFIGFDRDGFCYVAGTSSIVKLDEKLNKLAETSVYGDIRKALIYNGTTLIVFLQRTDESGLSQVYMSVFDNHLNKLAETCLSCGKEVSAYLDRGEASVYNGTIYIAGYSRKAGLLPYHTYIVVYGIQTPKNLSVATLGQTLASEDHKNQLMLVLPSLSIAIPILIAYLSKKRRAVRSKHNRRYGRSNLKRIVAMICCCPLIA